MRDDLGILDDKIIHYLGGVKDYLGLRYLGEVNFLWYFLEGGVSSL